MGVCEKRRGGARERERERKGQREELLDSRLILRIVRLCVGLRGEEKGGGAREG